MTEVGNVVDLNLNTVPEPSSLALLEAGVVGLLGWAWRRVALASRRCSP